MRCCAAYVRFRGQSYVCPLGQIRNQIVIGGLLLCRRRLFDRRSLDVGLFTLLIGLVQEGVDYARALLLLGPRFSRFLQLSEELVVDFPAHGILHR